MRKPSRRAVLFGAAVLGAVLLVANIAGILRVPVGPIDAGGYGVGLGSASAGVPMCVGLDPSNHWPVAATIEAVRLVNPSNGLRLVEARLIHPGLTTNGSLGVGTCEEADADLRMYSGYDPLPASLTGNNSISDGFMWIAVIADRPGELGFDAVEIQYRVGPFAFVDSVRLTFGACIAPMPAGAVCSWDSAQVPPDAILANR